MPDEKTKNGGVGKWCPAYISGASRIEGGQNTAFVGLYPPFDFVARGITWVGSPKGTQLISLTFGDVIAISNDDGITVEEAQDMGLNSKGLDGYKIRGGLPVTALLVGPEGSEGLEARVVLKGLKPAVAWTEEELLCVHPTVDTVAVEEGE